MNRTMIIAIISILIFTPYSNALKITGNDDYQKVLEASSSRINAVEGPLDIVLILNYDGTVKHSITSMKSIESIPSPNILFPWILPLNQSYRDITIYDLNQKSEMVLKRVTSLDLDNCNGEWIYNDVLNQILACSFATNSTEIGVRIDYTVEADIIQIPSGCSEPIDVSKNLSFIFGNPNGYSSSINIQIFGNEKLRMKVPILPNKSIDGQKLQANVFETENGYRISVPSQNLSKYLEMDMTIVGTKINEQEKIDLFQKNKQTAQNKYYDMNNFAIVWSILSIVFALINRKYGLDDKSKIKSLPLYFDIAFVYPIWGTFNGFSNDLSLGYVNIITAATPIIISILGIAVTIYVYIKPKGKLSVQLV